MLLYPSFFCLPTRECPQHSMEATWIHAHSRYVQENWRQNASLARGIHSTGLGWTLVKSERVIRVKRVCQLPGLASPPIIDATYWNNGIDTRSSCVRHTMNSTEYNNSTVRMQVILLFSIFLRAVRTALTHIWCVSCGRLQYLPTRTKARS